MSHFSNDLIADRAISDAIDAVDAMSDNKVKQVLFLNFGVKADAVDEIERDLLISKMANVFFADAMEVAGPHG
jgi:hypothetical protein